MKKIALLLCCIFTLSAAAQKKDDSKYLAGAITMEDGYVVFKQNYTVPGKTSCEILNQLNDYIQTKLVQGENSLEQSRITEIDKEKGLISASIAENLYFKRAALVTHFTRFFYQLIYRVQNEAFSIEMRRLRYSYDEMKTNGEPALLTAEEWITDNEALNKSKTKLTRIAGKFRKFTIIRKDQIFEESLAAACAGTGNKTKCQGNAHKCEGKEHKCDKANGKCEGKEHKCDKANGKCEGKEHKCDKANGKCEGKEHKCDKANGKCEGKEQKCDKTSEKCQGKEHKCEEKVPTCSNKGNC